MSIIKNMLIAKNYNEYISHYQKWYFISFKVLLVLVIPLGGETFHAAVYLMLALWALRSSRHALESLSLVLIVSSLNPAIYQLSDLSTFLHWFVIICAFITVALNQIFKSIKIPSAWVWLVVFVVIVALLSILSSYAIDISLFKLTSFFIGGTTILLGYHQTKKYSKYWGMWFYFIFVVTVFFSFPLIILSPGYETNGTGFQGIFDQPQAYAIFLSPFITWLLVLLLSGRLIGLFHWLVLLSALASLILTESRTGVFSLVLAFAFTIFWSTLQTNKSKQIYNWRLIKIIPIIFIGLFLVIVQYEEIIGYTNKFINKRQNAHSLQSAYLISRGSLIESSIQDFYKEPAIGIGFGVASNPRHLKIHRDPWLGLPISASTEKGFILTSILGETGLIGFIVFLLFLVNLYRPILTRHTDISAVGLSVSALLVNFGEAVFFSFGGMGLLIWLLIGFSRVMNVNTRS